MKLALALFFSLLLPISSFASTASLMEKIRNTPEYKKEVSDYAKLGGSFQCSVITETVKTRAYSRYSEESTRYALIVLDCIADPNDDGDPYHQAGLAVYANGEVKNFTTGYIPQPD